MAMSSPVLVTGATGTLGREVVARLRGDHEVRSMSRRTGPDLVTADLGTGAGLAAAVAGVGTVVHLASAAGGGRRTVQVDIAGTRRLLEASAKAGVRHLLYMSIVGIDRVPVSYYRAKLAAEEIVRRGPVPWSIVRATQFPQLLDVVLTYAGKLGVLVIDRGVKVQPVHPRDVAQLLVQRVGTGPTGRVEVFGGPEVLTLAELASAWQAARRTRKRVLPIRVPGAGARAARDGGLTTTARPTGTLTWADYLRESAGGRR